MRVSRAFAIAEKTGTRVMRSDDNDLNQTKVEGVEMLRAIGVKSSRPISAVVECE
jgi:hypothetical protein